MGKLLGILVIVVLVCFSKLKCVMEMYLLAAFHSLPIIKKS